MASVAIIILRVLLVESSNDDPFYEGSETTLNNEGLHTEREGVLQKGFSTIIYIYAYLLVHFYLTSFRRRHRIIYSYPSHW